MPRRILAALALALLVMGLGVVAVALLGMHANHEQAIYLAPVWAVFLAGCGLAWWLAKVARRR